MNESSPTPDALWPSPSGARWPKGAAIVQIALHPTLPWLTLACSNIERETGAVAIVNTASGALHGVYPLHDSLGSKYEPGGLSWHPDGRRLATHNDPSGVTVLEDGVAGIDNYPDDARGEPVHFAWVDHRIYSELGTIFDPVPAPGDYRSAQRSLSEIHWALEPFRRNDETGLVVGPAHPSDDADRKLVQLVAYDPSRDEVVYRVDTGRNWNGSAWSRKCRRVAVSPWNEDAIDVYDTTAGTLARRVRPQGQLDSEMAIADDGTLVILTMRELGASPGLRGDTIELFKPAEARAITLCARRRALRHDLVDRRLASRRVRRAFVTRSPTCARSSRSWPASDRARSSGPRGSSAPPRAGSRPGSARG